MTYEKIQFYFYFIDAKNLTDVENDVKWRADDFYNRE